ENFLFTGKEKDSSGLHYYGARYYDSSLGRFITRDMYLGESEDPQSLNRYTYCKNNPLKYRDQWGNFGVVEGLSSLAAYFAGSGTSFLALLIPVLPYILIAAVVIAVIIVAVNIYENYQEGKTIEVAQVRNIDVDTDSDLFKFGHKAVVNINRGSCSTESIVIHREDEEKFGHYTFWKEDGKWYYHPPGHPETKVLCNLQEAATLEALASEAERKYLEKTGGCPVTAPPSTGAGNSENGSDTQLPEGAF
ncbi:MAG: RHS repeat-associated core domain-containing protein, partial [Theionarchaea archaeon]|nr:RHS repeat-associated core domain-containing protein [Theionarchaea archaeon]